MTAVTVSDGLEAGHRLYCECMQSRHAVSARYALVLNLTANRTGKACNHDVRLCWSRKHPRSLSILPWSVAVTSWVVEECVTEPCINACLQCINTVSGVMQMALASVPGARCGVDPNTENYIMHLRA